MAWMRFRKKDMPGGLWLKCPSCGEVIYKKDIEENLKVCPKCDFHHTLSGMERVRFTLDPGSAEELIPDMEAVDRLEFVDKGPYDQKLLKTMSRTGRKEAIWIGTGTILGRKVAFGTLDFSFLGGSMGVVVGEKVAYLGEYALEHDLPLILSSASGGARMHEGALSLMQMAKTCTVLGRFDDASKLYIAQLANPTTGGVTASWATQADVVVAEPGALIGFAGPRVIKTTIRQDLPEGFQRSEFLIAKGQIDAIISRHAMRDRLWELMDYCLPIEGLTKIVPDTFPVVESEEEEVEAPADEKKPAEDSKPKKKPAPKKKPTAKKTAKKKTMDKPDPKAEPPEPEQGEETASINNEE